MNQQSQTQYNQPHQVYNSNMNQQPNQYSVSNQPVMYAKAPMNKQDLTVNTQPQHNYPTPPRDTMVNESPLMHRIPMANEGIQHGYPVNQEKMVQNYSPTQDHRPTIQDISQNQNYVNQKIVTIISLVIFYEHRYTIMFRVIRYVIYTKT